MNRYIDATDLAKKIADFKKTINSPNSDYMTGYLCALSVSEGMIANAMIASTADVVEVRHGEWVTPKSRDADDWVECSRCGDYFDISVGQEPTPYCPNCGAKMDGKGREENGKS